MTHDDSPKRLAVFELGPIPEPLRHRYPYYPEMIRQWLAPALPEMSFTGLSPIHDGALPPPDAFDGYIYSGSRYGVYDDKAWMEPVKAFIRNVAESGGPQFGICFGHQIIAEAFGGRVVKSDRGRGCGVHIYDMRLDEADPRVSQVPVMVWHQDQVIAAPDGAEVIGGSDFCPIGALRYRQNILSVQFHPEFTDSYMRDLLDVNTGGAIPSERIEAARRSLSTPHDGRLIADWTARFFRRQLS